MKKLLKVIIILILSVFSTFHIGKSIAVNNTVDNTISTNAIEDDTTERVDGANNTMALNNIVEDSIKENKVDIQKNIDEGNDTGKISALEIKKEHPIEDGTYVIETAQNPNRVIEVINAYSFSGANVQTFTKNNAKCQNVIIRALGDGYYTLQFEHSGMYLDVANGKKTNGTNVWQCRQNGSDAQKWMIKDVGDGYYNIISKCSNTYLTVAGGVDRNCTNIEINEYNKNNSQKFRFAKPDVIEKVTGTKTIEDGTYVIETGVNSNKALDVINAVQYSGGNVQIFTKNNARCQSITVKYIGDGYYTLQFNHSSLFLEVVNGDQAYGTNVCQYGENNSDSQKWIIKDAGGGYYNIVSKCSNTYLTVANGSDINCTNIEINKPQNNKSQKFKFIKQENVKGMKAIDDGVYAIETGVNSNKVLDVIDAVKYSGGNVQIFTKNNARCQKVEVKYLGDGYYTIQFRHSGMLLDVANGETVYGNNVWQCTRNDSDAQKWVIKDLGDGYYNIISKCSNTYLTVTNGTDKNCANIEINKQRNDKSQKFRFIKQEVYEGTKTIDDGVYVIETGVNSNKAIDVIDAVTYSGGNVQIFTKNNARCQKVAIKYVGDGYYTIQFRHSGKLLDVANGVALDGTNVWQCNDNGSDAQKWIIKDLGNGYYNIISKCSDTFLTVKNGKDVNCTNIEINSKKNNNSQQFKFVKQEVFDGTKTISDGIYVIETGINSNKALDVIDAATYSGGNVQIYTKNNARCQKVSVKYVGNGYYTLQFRHSSMYLDVANGIALDGTNVWQCRENDSDAQKWIIKDAGGGYYNIISKCSDTYLTVAYGLDVNCANIEINSYKGNNSQKFKFVATKDEIPFETGYYGSSGLKVKGDWRGQSLKYYKIGNGPNVFFGTFAIHGWEDDFNYDGQELTKIAEDLKNKLISMQDFDLANKWTIYILPSLNPDGEYYGWSHDGPGRTTLYSASSTHQGIDMNRTWSTEWTQYKTTRNYNGTAAFQAYEARDLRDFLLARKSTNGQTVLVDLHGWLNETLGDDGIGQYYRSQLGMSKHIYSYGRGYLINWARANLGSNGRRARSALVELPAAYSSAQVANWGLANKYINATINMLRGI